MITNELLDVLTFILGWAVGSIGLYYVLMWWKWR